VKGFIFANSCQPFSTAIPKKGQTSSLLQNL